MDIFKLRPNCLLTRYPLVFYTKSENFIQRLIRSMTQKFFPWAGIPNFIRRHGYQVIVKNEVTLNDPELPERFHLIAERPLNPEKISLLKASRRIASVTLVDALLQSPQRAQRRAKRMIFLDHCIFLAEDDLTTAK